MERAREVEPQRKLEQEGERRRGDGIEEGSATRAQTTENELNKARQGLVRRNCKVCRGNEKEGFQAGAGAWPVKHAQSISETLGSLNPDQLSS